MEQIKMSDEAKAIRAAYQKEYRRKNPGKVKQYNIEYWERKATGTTDIESKLIELRKQGCSLREIADQTGINHMKVSRILKSKGDV